MGKLEGDVYRNFYNNAILRVTSKEARYYYYGLKVKSKNIYPLQEIGLENFPYLQTFINKANHYMEMKYNAKSKLYSVSLWELGENKKANMILFEKEGLAFLPILGEIEEDLAMKQYRNLDNKVKNQLQWNGCFEISGTPKVNGVYIYEEQQIKSISETEFNMEDYLLNNGCSFLYQAILSGKIVEIRYEEQQFLLELFSLVRSSYSGPFQRKVENYLKGEQLLSCLKKMNKYLEEEIILSRRLKS